MSEGSRDPEKFDSDDPSAPVDMELERWKRETTERYARIQRAEIEFLRSVQSFDEAFAGTFLGK